MSDYSQHNLKSRFEDELGVYCIGSDEEVGEYAAFIRQPALMLQTHVQREHFVKGFIPH